MAQDLRKLFKEQREEKKYQMKEGHAERFFSKLETELPEKVKPNSYFWLKIAASVIIMIGLASYFFMNRNNTIEPQTTIVDNSDTKETNISLSDLSPDLQKIENYYVANINLELANLEVSDDNKGIVDGYMEQLEVLDLEYKKLNKELNEFGPNDQTIEALIQNLQLRLQLLKKLKEKLKEKLNQLKLSKNEQATII